MSFEISNLDDSSKISIIKLNDIISSARQSNDMLQIFFIAIGLIALILSFFLIWISFYSNIKDNICEYGIMRAIGLTKLQSLRIYLYEAMVLILTAIVIGTFIGIVVSTTLILQFNLFSEFPFRLLVFFFLFSFLIHYTLFYAFLE